MAFSKGNKLGHRFTSENQPAGKGRPEGPMRSTIAKKVLAMLVKLPDEAFEKLQQLYPSLNQIMTSEEVATLIQISNAITKGDTQAYKAIMDSAYGAPKQEIEADTNQNITITIE